MNGCFDEARKAALGSIADGKRPIRSSLLRPPSSPTEAAARHGLSEAVKVSRRLPPGTVTMRHCLDLARCRISGIRGASLAKQMRRKLTVVNDECRRGSLRSLIEFTGCAGDRLADVGRGRTSLVRVVDLVSRKMSTPDSVERALDLLQGVERPLILPGKA